MCLRVSVQFRRRISKTVVPPHPIIGQATRDRRITPRSFVLTELMSMGYTQDLKTYMIRNILSLIETKCSEENIENEERYVHLTTRPARRPRRLRPQ